MEKLFISLYRLFAKRRLLFWFTLVLFFLLAGFFASKIKLEEDIAGILPKDEKVEKLNEVFQNSKFLDKLVITVSLKDSTKGAAPDSLVAYADALVAALRDQYNGYITRIQDRADDSLVLQMFDVISNNLPLYLDEKDYARIDTLLQPAVLRATLERNIRTLGSPAGIALKSMIVKDPTGISMLGLKKLQQLQFDENFELYDNYIVTKDQQRLMLFITPAFPPNNTGKNQQLLAGIDKLTDSLSSRVYNNVHAEYFGATAVAAGNAAQLRKDTLLTQGITVLFLVLFIGFYFRKKRAPFLVLLPVVFGALFSLALLYLLKGSISVIALATGSVILGIAVNYSLHVFNHYRHTHSIEQVISDLTMPLTVGSLTTVGGFLCLQFVKSAMLKDLGLFAAFSLIGASLCSLIFLPHLIVSEREEKSSKPPALTWIDRIAGWKPEHNRYLLLAILVLTFVFAYTAGSVRFEPDMMRMNFVSNKLKQADSNLSAVNAYSLQSVYLLSTGKNLEEALEKNEQAVAKVQALQDKGIVKKYSGVAAFMPSNAMQQQKIERWNRYWTAARQEQVLALLQQEGSQLKYNANAFAPFQEMLRRSYMPVSAASVAIIRKSFLDDYITERPGKVTVITLAKVAAPQRQQVYQAFEKGNTTAVDKQYLTGRFVEIINADFGSIALMSSILVFIVLLISYGRIELTLVSFIPMFISWIWILGIMGLAGISFNIVNIIISALIFGLGDDYSLFIMDGLLQEYKTGKKNLASYKSSILLSAITTIAGLGVLIFAKHPALRSIAIIAIIGILCVVVIGQLLIPFLFNFLVRDRIRHQRFPWTFFGLLKSAFAFTFFACGSVAVALTALLFVKLYPFNKEKGKLIYHRLLARFSRSLLYIMPNVKKRILNPLKEDFSTPAVVICNHQSSLDVMLAMMLHPKIILFINKRVWHLPFVGFVVRAADFFPTTENAEEGLEKIAARVKQGYSVWVFPEGTRSTDGQLKRFHKGAFYVAEKLNLDILPILIHGTHYALSKDDFLVKDGAITVAYLPRIKPTDTAYGTGYAERTKKISRYFKTSFEALRQQEEQPAYFNEQLRYNFIYKGPVLEWYMRIKVKLEKNYQLFNRLLPASGRILDIGCGYGFMSYLLHFVSPARQMTGLDYDEEKIATANHCFSKDDGLNFVCADITQWPFEQYDAIVMMDILHYLQPAQQKLVIEKSIASVTPGGLVIIRDGNAELEGRHRGTRLTELFSTAVFGFNKTTEKGLSFLSGSTIKAIAAAHNMDCIEIDETKFTSNIVFVLKHRQA
ncbi:MAG TPA: 1-acyl-sn-glycerol-3-phosphate acyltransferase [Chitinophagaceae bacterium]|nr:1-acyl-sn-glycerol-3-phosphate acyltransferase [Chitinophagaceae bacterium]